MKVVVIIKDAQLKCGLRGKLCNCTLTELRYSTNMSGFLDIVRKKISVNLH